MSSICPSSSFMTLTGFLPYNRISCSCAKIIFTFLRSQKTHLASLGSPVVCSVTGGTGWKDACDNHSLNRTQIQSSKHFHQLPYFCLFE